MEISKIIFVIVMAGIMALAGWLSTMRYKKMREEVESEKEGLMLDRLSCYQTVFVVMVIYLFLNWIFALTTGLNWADLYTLCFIGFLLMMYLFITLAMKRKAYGVLNENLRPRPLFIAIGFVGAIYLGLALVNIIYNVNYKVVYDGTLTYLSANLELGIMLLVLAVTLLVILHQQKIEKKNIAS
ncbi:hypothetical protein [Eubacterium oxidoreducens]|uniref:Uncharacterized protein n=1 Tax=Eubacterium oxidoreducens TaxID=1732 RepID=A0A1G6C0W2_EUBOX|nr:hypothetical protein [Eubacterium oxidoreducens]SDB26519.1 hypothetical protein SAMN02910417_01954 [Eubacterium oxidoreducens]